MKSGKISLFDCSKEKLTSLLRSRGVVACGRIGRKSSMQNTNDLPADNAPAKVYKIKHNVDNYCRLLWEYDDYLENTRNRGLGNKECDHIMEFLNWLLTVKDADLTVKDLHGWVKGEVRHA